MKVPRKKNPIGQRVGGPHRDSSAPALPEVRRGEPAGGQL